jgi:two-component system sensor histidine kinase KdpD
MDTRRITQVIFNLVSNAVKFSPPESDITITAFAIEDGIQIEVADEGIGIPPEKRDLVFEPFQQLNSANQAMGTGLGLAICKGIVEAHGGDLWIADNEGGGTKICFTLTAASKAKNEHTVISSADS